MEELRQTLDSLLTRWAGAQLSAAEVHEAAESLLAEWDWEQRDRREPISIVNEVVARLDLLDVQWIVREDVPAMRDFLSTPAGEEPQAWRAWEAYWEAVDYEERGRSFGGNRYYASLTRR